MSAKKSLPVILLLVLCAAGVATLLGCSRTPSITLVPAPPGPADLGPATGLSTPSVGTIVFDLKYHAQTGGTDDIPYRSYWGYGGRNDETETDPFLQAVRKQVSGRLHYTYNDLLTGRGWAAVEWRRRQPTALYFDLNADGQLAENERIPPTCKSDEAIEFITPDFVQPLEGGGQTFCRVLLNVQFYEWSSEPNTMWSPASLLEGTATLDGRTARLLLYANGPGGAFDQYGSSRYSLLRGSSTNLAAGEYIPRETLSSVIASEGQFYKLTLDGRRSNGLPARVLLMKDTSPTGTLAVKLAGTSSLPTTLSHAYLHGVDDKTVYFRVSPGKDTAVLPVGTYTLTSGTLAYGESDSFDWQLSFSQGPPVTVKAGEVIEQRLGQPGLKVRAVKEKERWNRKATASDTFKRGTTIYLEPRIIGKGGEVFTRFQQAVAGKKRKTDRPPRITITGPDGKQLFNKVMEYG